MERLLFKCKDDEGLAIELKPGLNRIGRSRANDFCIDHDTISSVHCEAELRNGQVIVRDLGSTNGIFIDGERVTEARLDPGQVLRVGDVEILLETAPVVIAIPEVNFAEPGPPPPMEDGAIPCLNHGDIRAVYHCAQCNRFFCPACVHKIGLVGAQTHLMCPVCSGRCELLPEFAAIKGKKSVFAWLRDALKSCLKR